jgi:hypothetical protein
VASPIGPPVIPVPLCVGGGRNFAASGDFQAVAKLEAARANR